MKVFLIGQRGIPANNYYDQKERRAESMAKWAIERGYEVLVVVEKHYGASHLSNWHGAHILPVSGRIGTLSYALRLALRLWREKPDIVHIQGWQAVRWARLWRWVAGEATFLWTIPAIPREGGKKYQKLLSSGFELFQTVTTPSREVQYVLLHQYEARIQYIPDGFTADTDSIPVSQWGLKRGQYVAVTATSAEDLQWMCRAFERLRTKKKLVVFHPHSAEMRKLERRYGFLEVIPVLTERVYHSLLRQSGVVVAASPYGVTEPLLQAMAAKRAVVSVNHPLNEEILGSTGRIVLQGDEFALEEALRTVISKPAEQTKWGSKAAKRAQNHFGWSRVMTEYAALYAPAMVRQVPMDSLVERHLQV